MSWHPEIYLRFGQDRLRPVLDLISRLPDTVGDHRPPEHIVDLGCGTGSGAKLLLDRYPQARLTGVDNSADMLDRARRDVGDQNQRAAWVEADIADYPLPDDADIIFSNAALHWVDDHAVLFPRLMSGLRPGGLLAIQMPANFHAPSHRLLKEIARLEPWGAILGDVRPDSPVADPRTYYGVLAPHASDVDIWSTEYLHVLSGENPVLVWTRGTALLPYLQALPESMSEAFLQRYAAALHQAYPPRADGLTLFPFQRMFILARKA